MRRWVIALTLGAVFGVALGAGWVYQDHPVPGTGREAGEGRCLAEYSGTLTGKGAPDRVTVRAASVIGATDTETTYDLRKSEDVAAVAVWLKAPGVVATTWCWEGEG
jgi:hypothetical protein